MTNKKNIMSHIEEIETLLNKSDKVLREQKEASDNFDKYLNKELKELEELKKLLY